jgi:glycosyltransferase involved in cell wall biosynthesis
MPTYNFARYLPEAIESVLAQTLNNFEFIIIDDCSQDESAVVIAKYAEKDRRIRFSVNEHNLGLAQNWNLCLERARGEYIKFLFGDDVLASPEALVRMVSVLDAEKDVALVASARYIIDEGSRVVGTVSDYAGRRRERGTTVIRGCLLEQKNDVGEPSVVMFRKQHASRGFHPGYKQLVDLEMWFHILEQGDFAYLDEPLCSFRVHAKQQTRRNIENCLVVDDVSLLLKEYGNKPYLKFSRLERAYMSYLPAYATWKLYRKHRKISRQAALERLRTHHGYSYLRFLSFFPVYKICKLILEIRKSGARSGAGRNRVSRV